MDKTFYVLFWSQAEDSPSHVLTATFLSYGKAKNSTPDKIKTPDLIEIKFGTVNYVGSCKSAQGELLGK